MADPQTARIATSLPEARRILGQIGLPVVISPAFTIGRQPTVAATNAEFEDAVQHGLDASVTSEVLIEFIPHPQVGQVWRPLRGGMWRTIVAIHAAGIEWTASPDEHAFSRFESWDRWIRDAQATPASEPPTDP